MEDSFMVMLSVNQPRNETQATWYNSNTTTTSGNNVISGNSDLFPSSILPDEEEYATLYEASVEVVALLSIFYGGISIIAVIGNTLVIWIVTTTRQMHTVTNMYIANLAFADVIIGMFCIPFQFQAALLQRWNLPDFMCAFCPFIQVLSVNVSVFTLTAIAVDRHRAIINPLRTRPSKFISKVIISIIWIAALCFAIPIAIAFRVVQITERRRAEEDGVIQNITRPFCENVNLTDEQLQSYRYYLVFIQYLVPFCVISFVYIQMAVNLWGSRTPGNAQDTRDIALLRNKKKVIKMLIIVVVVFGVCWLPLQSYNILHVTWPDVNEYRFINIIWFCCDWLAMSNSCYNPFIYGIYNEKFKREFNKRFSVCFCKFDGHDGMDRTMSVFTRASSVRSNYTNTSTRRNNLLVHPQHQHQHQHQNQQRNAITKTFDAYNTITDLEHRAPMMNNNRMAGSRTKALWIRGAVSANRFHHRNIAGTVDCPCTGLALDNNGVQGKRNENSGNSGGNGDANGIDSDQWIKISNCKGTCLGTPIENGSMIITTTTTATANGLTKPISKATKSKLSSILKVGLIRKNDDIKRDNLEMTEYCLVASNGFHQKNGKNNSVKFNNF